jgi:hypothetical protein
MTQPVPSGSDLPPHDGRLAAAPTHTSVAVVLRFLLRMVILGIFATIGSLGFLKTLESLLVMATLYCFFAAAFRREAPFGPALTHFDEAAAYALIACMAFWAA